MGGPPCSRCAGDPQHDWRLAFQPDPADELDERKHNTVLGAAVPSVKAPLVKRRPR